MNAVLPGSETPRPTGEDLTIARDFLPWSSSVHRGAGCKSRLATAAHEEARSASLAFAGRRADRRAEQLVRPSES
jgi:hypothetical protein